MPRRAIIQFHVFHGGNALRNNNNDVRYPLIHMRDHLFHVAFVRIAIIYATLFPGRARKIIEFIILTSSFLSLVLLSYIHVAFVQSPSNCLEHVQDKWPRDGILRVEILKEKLNGKYTLEKSYLREKKIKEMEYIDLSYFFLNSGVEDAEDYKYLMDMQDIVEVDHNSSETISYIDSKSTYNVSLDEELNSEADEITVPDITEYFLPTLAWTDDEYIMEFSLEYGFLKLSPSIRKQYNISVELVTLNPEVDKCFGGTLNNFILHKFLGYDEVLLASLKLLASKEQYKGYVRNTLSEVEFVFVNAWMDKKAYITAGFVMMVFTISISILLRYSHHQIFVFIVELLHMFEFQSSFNFPAGPLLTVILALVGMEAIMSEFFNDTAIAFYVILIVWMADQYDTICCKSFFTKKHWLRFFYLYHFFFYAYSYRFGHNRFLALLTSWLFTVHSMVYFFHRYELPILTAHRVRRNYAHRNSGNPSPPSNSNAEAANNQSQNASVGPSNSEGASNTPNLSSPNDNVSTDHNNPTNDNSVEQLHSTDDSFVQQINILSTCLLVNKASVKNSTSSKVSSVHNKRDEMFYHMPTRLTTVQKLEPDSKPKAALNIILLSLKKNIEIVLMNLKPFLILFFLLLFCNRTFTAVLNSFLTKVYSYEGLEGVGS